jgi:hypothetical protein
MSASLWYFCNSSSRKKQENMHLIFAEPITEELEQDEGAGNFVAKAEDEKENPTGSEIQAAVEEFDKK